MKHNEFDERRKTLHAIQKIFGICATPFTELEKTGEVSCNYLKKCLSFKFDVFLLRKTLLLCKHLLLFSQFFH